MEQLLKSKNTIKNDQWTCFINNLFPVFPILYCCANQTSNFGQTIFNFFDPDQAEKFNNSQLVVCFIYIFIMSKHFDIQGILEK